MSTEERTGSVKKIVKNSTLLEADQLAIDQAYEVEMSPPYSLPPLDECRNPEPTTMAPNVTNSHADTVTNGLKPCIFETGSSLVMTPFSQAFIY